MKVVLKTHKKIIVVAGSILILLITLGFLTYNMAVTEIGLINSSISSTMSTFQNKYHREKSIYDIAADIDEELIQGTYYIITKTLDESTNVQQALDILGSNELNLYLIDESGETYVSKGAGDLNLSSSQYEQLLRDGNLSVESDGGVIYYGYAQTLHGMLISCYKKSMEMEIASAMTGISQRYHYFIAPLSDGIITDSDKEALIGTHIPERIDTSFWGLDKECHSKIPYFKSGIADLSTGRAYCLTYEEDGYIAGLYYGFSEIGLDILNELITPLLVVGGSYVVILVFFFTLWRSTDEKNKKWVRLLRTGDYVEESQIKHLSCFVLFALIIVLLFSTHLFEFSSYSMQSVLSTENLDMLSDNMEACEKDKKLLIGYVESYTSGIADRIADILTLNQDLCSHENLKEMADNCSMSNISIYDKDGILEASSGDYFGYELTTNENDTMYAARRVLTDNIDSVFVEYNDESGRFLQAQKRKDAPGIICLEYESRNLSEMLKYFSKDDVIRNTDFGNATTFFIKLGEESTYVVQPYSTDIKSTQIEIPEKLNQDNYSGISTINGIASYVNTKNSGGIEVISAIACDSLNNMLGCNLLVLSGGFVLLMLVLLYGCICRPEAIAIEEDALMSKPETVTGRNEESIFADNCFRRMIKYEVIVIIAGYCFMMLKKTANGQTLLEFIFGGKWDKGFNLFSINASIIVAIVVIVALFLIKKLLTFIGRSIGTKGMTISSIAISIISFLGLFFIILHTLYQFGVNTTALLASAGIAGLVIGIAAKDIFGDLIAGLFLIFEGNIRVGDFVKFKDFRGEVTEIGARVTVIKRYNNKLIVNNSDLKQYYRLSDEYGAAWVEIEVAPDEDITRIKQLITDSGEWYRSRIPTLMDGPWFLNVSNFDSSGITICLCGACTDERSGSTRRKILFNTIELFRENGIRLGKNVMKIEVEKEDY